MRPLLLTLLVGAVAFAAKDTTGTVTFHRDVLPVLQHNCQGCHRPGEAAPMSLLTYKEARPWAKAMREAVLLKKMPPWFADPHVGKFVNDRSLAQKDIDTLVKWADSGAPEGDPNDAPKPVRFLDGWNIGTPDMVVEMPNEIDVPAKGTIEYTYYVMPTGFTEDKWVRMSEVRPGNRRVVHHVIAFVREPGSNWLKEAKPGVPYVPKKGTPDSENAFGGQWLVGYAPGTIPDELDPGQARLIKAGSDIILQLHYTADGKPEKDRTKVGFIFANEPPKERIFTMAVANGKFAIPPGADNHRVDSSFTIQQDVTLISMLPHMHLRGKAFEYRVTYPDGRKEEILRVPKYDFSWQLTYVPEKPLFLPKGSVVQCTAWFDNSPNNPNNPDPTAEVHFGDQSWEEMMIGFLNVAFDPSIPLKDLFPKPPEKRSAPPSAE
jgi:hypothetical protein